MIPPFLCRSSSSGELVHIVGVPSLLPWTSAGNGGGYWTSNTALSGFVTTNLDLLVPGPGGFQTNTHLFSGGILVVSNTATSGGTNYLAAGSRVTVVTNSALWTVSADAQTNAVLANLANTGAITNVLAGSNATVQVANYVATVNSIPPTDGANLTNLVYGPVSIAGTGIAIVTNTVAATGQKTYTISATSTNETTVTNVTVRAGPRILVTTNSTTDWTIEAEAQTNSILANIALTGAITNVVAGSNTTVQIANNIATVNAVINGSATNVINLAAGSRITIVTNSSILNTISADAQTNGILASIALTGAITNVTAGSNATVQVANNIATVNGVLYPTHLITTDGLAPIAISGWPDGDLIGIFTNSAGAGPQIWYNDLVGYFVFNKGVVASEGFFGDGSGLTNTLGSIVISGIGIGVATNMVAATGQKTYTLTYTGTNSVSVTNVTLRAGAGVGVTTNAATDWTVSSAITNSTSTVGVVGTGSIGTNLSTLVVSDSLIAAKFPARSVAGS